ncbi:twin-arginine translocase TatA/TatE family subunit [Colibacter massiliensis]|uniref:twin-arginine translocase TatA/TatE family subunit n=2 Tax=Colibacter massiliensis TaxID=1852379 RepID=UPI003C6F8DFD
MKIVLKGLAPMHLGIQELLVILVIVLVLFGGKKVSGLGKALGTSLREFKQEVNKSDAAETSEKKESESDSDKKED